MTIPVYIQQQEQNNFSFSLWNDIHKTTELLIDILLMLSRSPLHFQGIFFFFFSVESHKIAKFSFHFEQTALSLLLRKEVVGWR